MLPCPYYGTAIVAKKTQVEIEVPDPSLAEAAEKVRVAREELRRVEAEFEDARRKSSQEGEDQEPMFPEFVTQTLRWVRKYPGPGVAGALMIGFLMGRLSRH